MECYERELLDFEDYVEARGAWAYIFWMSVFILGIAILLYSNNVFLSIY